MISEKGIEYEESERAARKTKWKLSQLIKLSILFAYITNKRFVFQTKNTHFKENAMNFFRFIGLRFVSGLADMGTMWILVDLITIDTRIAKLATQFIVVVLNYVFSKFLIFV